MKRKKLIKIVTLICCGLVFVIGFSIGEKFFRRSSLPQKKEALMPIQPKLEEKKLKQKEELILSSQEKKEEVEEKDKIIEKKDKIKEKVKKEELISPQKQTTKRSIHIALSSIPSDKIHKEKKYHYKKQIFASAYKDKALAIKRLLLKEFNQIQLEIKPVKINDKLIYRVILLSTTPQPIETIKKRIEDLSKSKVVLSKQPTKSERQIQIFATSDSNKANLIKKHLKELNYDAEVIKVDLQSGNIIYRIYLQGDEEKIIKQAQDIKENKIIENIFTKPYLKEEKKEEEGKYIIQVASLTNAASAENLLKQLREVSKLPTYVKVVKMSDRVEYKVRVLGFSDRETTIKFAQELLTKGVIPSYVILKE